MLAPYIQPGIIRC